MIKSGFPPNIEEIAKVFMHQTGVVYCFGADIYNPDNSYIDEPQLVHEGIHTTQQGDKPQDWWERYLRDNDFRFAQELEAFQAQYRCFCERVKDRNYCDKYLRKLARSLSSETYGKICNLSEAMQAINSKVKFKC